MEFTEDDYYELFDECCEDSNAYHAALYSIVETIFWRFDEEGEANISIAERAANEQLDTEVIYSAECEKIIVSYGLSNALDTFNEWKWEMGGDIDLDIVNLAIAVLYKNLPSMEKVVDLYNEKLEEEEEEEEEE